MINNFDELIKSEKCLVDFNATWCGPCKMMEPILENLEKDIKVIKVDIDENEELANKYMIYSIPTLIIFNKGSEIKRIIGYHSYEEIIEVINDI